MRRVSRETRDPSTDDFSSWEVSVSVNTSPLQGRFGYAEQVEKEVQERVSPVPSCCSWRSFLISDHLLTCCITYASVPVFFHRSVFLCRRSRGGQFKQTAQRFLFELSLMSTRVTPTIFVKLHLFFFSSEKHSRWAPA